MKTTITTTKSSRRSLAVAIQIFQLIPPGLIDGIAEEEGAEVRSFTCSNQVMLLMFGQLSGAFSLNEICDASEVHRKKLSHFRGMQPAHRNTFSHANRTRTPAVAERLFWAMKKRLESVAPRFMHPRHKGHLARFRYRSIFAIDSTTIQLSAKSIDWARHRRQKAAAKLHMRCDVASRLPSFACVTPAKPADNREMEHLCLDLKADNIAIFDRAYNDFGALGRLDARGIFFVVREKELMQYAVKRRVPKRMRPLNVLSDETIVLTGVQTSSKYPVPLRRVRVRVDMDGDLREMVFLTNNMQWSAMTIAELYLARWQVELLFKELKQTLQLRDFYGENASAVAWQIWTALLTHMLLRHLAFCSSWHASYTRFAGVIRAALWERQDLMTLLRFYGTATPPPATAWNAKVPCLPGLERYAARSMGQHQH